MGLFGDQVGDVGIIARHSANNLCVRMINLSIFLTRNSICTRFRKIELLLTREVRHYR